MNLPVELLINFGAATLKEGLHRIVNNPPTSAPPRLVAELHAQFAESAKLEQAIKANLRGLGYGG